MSGIFKYQQNSGSNRRSMFGSFSASQNDTTMDNSYGMGFRSGGAQASPGRSLREYEEQMTALRKENFNLKLRIYFLEEKNSGGTTDTDTVLKQNVDLKVENEAFRNELQEKQDLLIQAAKAMTLMEESQKATDEKNQNIIDELNQKLELMEAEMQSAAEQERYVGASCQVDIQHRIQDLEVTLAHQRLQNDELLAQLSEKNDLEVKIKILEQQLGALTFEKAELQNHLDEKQGTVGGPEVAKCKKDLYELKKSNAETLCELEDTKVQLKKSAKFIQSMMQKQGEHEQLIETMREQRKRFSEVTQLLTVRLKELAMFLDTLLTNGEFKNLGADRRTAIKKAVDNSLDLSRSMTNEIRNESLFSNLSAYLNMTEDDGIDMSMLKSDKDLVIERLTNELAALRKELGAKPQTPSKVNFDGDDGVQASYEESDADCRPKTKQKKLKTKKQLTNYSFTTASASTSDSEDVPRSAHNNSSLTREFLGLQDKLAGLQSEMMANEAKHKQEKLEIGENAEKLVAVIREERDQMQIKLRVSDLKLQQIQQDIVRLRETHANELVAIMETEEERRQKEEKKLKDEYNSQLAQCTAAFEDQIKNNYIAREIYNKLVQQVDDISEQLNASAELIEQLKKDVAAKDSERQVMRRHLDEATLQLSKLGVQRAKTQSNERQLLEKLESLEELLNRNTREKLDLVAKISEMESTNAQLQNQVLAAGGYHSRQKGTTSDYSHSAGYTSEECGQQRNVEPQVRLNNSSPDLGIESSENTEGHNSLKNRTDELLERNLKLSPLKENDQNKKAHNCDEVDLENAVLKKKLLRTRRALEETFLKLKLSNQKKEQVEKDIRQQILKTQNVLKNVRHNMENELEKKNSS